MNPKAIAIGAVVVLTCGLAIVGADQGRGAEPTLGSMSELTNEVRLLRQAVEKASPTQSQVQAMAVYLSAQQNRMNQSVARLDTLRRELDGINRKETEIPRQIRDFEQTLASGVLNTAPQAREKMQEMIQSLKAEMSGLAGVRARVGAQVAEADAALANDLARWADMITRLEQLTRP